MKTRLAQCIPALLALPIACLLSGCEAPANYLRPRLAFTRDHRAYLAMQRSVIGPRHPEYLVLTAEPPAYDAWRVAGHYAGTLAALLQDEDGDGWVAVHGSGTTLRMRPGENAAEIIAPAGSVSLVAAAWMPGNAATHAAADGPASANGVPGAERALMALDASPDGMRLMRLEKGVWEPLSPPLPEPPGGVWQAHMAAWGSWPVVGWSPAVIDAAHPAPGAAWLWRGEWQPLAPPPDASPYSTLAGDLDGGLWWMTDGFFPPRPATPDRRRPQPDRLRVWHAPPPGRLSDESEKEGESPGRSRLPPPAWTESAAIPLAAEWRANRTYGSALAVPPAPDDAALAATAPLLMALRSDGDAIRAWRLPRVDPNGDSAWLFAGEVWRQGQIEAWALVRVLAMVAALLAAMAAARVWGQRSLWPGRRKTLPGAPGAMLDRMLAFWIDAALMLPLPVAFHLRGSDYGWYRFPPAHQFQLYLAWMAGLIAYKTLFEAMWGRTIGKWALGLRVRSGRPNGGPASAGQILARNLALAIDCFPLTFGGDVAMPYLIALAAMAFNKKRRRVGDWLGGTLVRRHIPLSRRRVILASASPRRRELLRAYGLEAAVAASAAENGPLEEQLAAAAAGPGAAQTPEDCAARLAEAKALAYLRQCECNPDSPAYDPNHPDFPLVIAADTLVIRDEVPLGKPATPEEAVAMLLSLSGKTHKVITALTLIDTATRQRLTRVETTFVEMRALNPFAISTYVATGEPFDKAGGYGLQGLGGKLVRDVRGSVSNVIGLPIELLGAMLAEMDG